MGAITAIPPIVAWPLLLLALGLLARLTVILVGMYKEPLLRLFEKYGDEENQFHIIPRVLLYSGLLLYSLRSALAGLIAIPPTVDLLGILLMICGYFYTRFPEEWKTQKVVIGGLPAWYVELRARTTREERRRIAYMWLRLPLRTRLLYNANNRAFFLWADLVIMATLQFSE
jgi:hypothetical protein